MRRGVVPGQGGNIWDFGLLLWRIVTNCPPGNHDRVCVRSKNQGYRM